MGRRLMAILAILSVAIWVVAAAAWVRSYRLSEEIELTRRDPFPWDEPVRYSYDRDGTRTRNASILPLWRDRIFSLGWGWGSVQFASNEFIMSDFRRDSPLQSPPGEWQVHLHQYRGPQWRAWPWLPRREQHPRIRATSWEWVGFGGTRQLFPQGPDDPRVEKGWSVAVPFWFIMLAATAIPALWWRSYRRDRQRRRWIAANRCGVCGYDLRHAPPRCPECGIAVASPAPRLDPPPQPADNPS